MSKESHILVGFEGKEYGVVLAVEGFIVDKVKKLLVQELKDTRPNLFGHMSIDLEYITLYNEKSQNNRD
jgi:hypothetical protein